MKKAIVFLAAFSFAFVCGADQTISWPSDYQANLERHIAETEPPSVDGSGPSDVISYAYLSLATPSYGTSELTFESVWLSLSATKACPGIELGMPGFLLFMK